MKYNNPQFRDAITAEYVLGTLQGAARRRFERSLKDDPRLRQLVAHWQERLAPLDEMVEPVKPPARVWRRIEERISAASGRRHWLSDVGFWRSASIVQRGLRVAARRVYRAADAASARRRWWW